MDEPDSNEISSIMFVWPRNLDTRHCSSLSFSLLWLYRINLKHSCSHKTNGGSTCPALLASRIHYFPKQYHKFFCNPSVKVHCTLFFVLLSLFMFTKWQCFLPVGHSPSYCLSSFAQWYTTHFFDLLWHVSFFMPFLRPGKVFLQTVPPFRRAYSLFQSLRISRRWPLCPPLRLFWHMKVSSLILKF